ncbi:MAG: hypothetical protein HY906_13540 [Deltaproteobacteria bacterium]|nr:hypothetical protein [Deltaproteobacteria bacterium]
MSAFVRKRFWLLLAVTVGACGGGGNGGDDDAGIEGTCTITGKNSADKAQVLVLGQEYPNLQEDGGTPDPNDTCIYPMKVQRWFYVDLPAGQPLLTVEIMFAPQAKSKINLAYLVLADPPDLEHPVASKTDSVETVHSSHVLGTHYIPSPGKYYIMVHDANDNAQDDVNTFSITASAMADPDPNAGHTTCDNATPLGSGQDGYVSYQGDHGAYKVNVLAGSKIVEIQLDYTGQALAGRIAVDVYQPDGNTLVGEYLAVSGATPTLLKRTAMISTGADYCLIVRDSQEQGADLQNKYHISATVIAEPDANEQSARNDTVTAATDVSGGGSRTGYIASSGDADWYKVSQSPNQLMELRAQGGGSRLALGMKIVYPHNTSPCTPGSGDSCAYLTGTTTCNLPTDCLSNVCQRGRCALECETNLDCDSHFCSAGACAGGGECLPEGQCSVTQYIIPAVTGNDVHTVQPAKAASTYVLVYDTHNPPLYDDSTAYTFTFTRHAEPDPGEPDNFYNPFLTLESPDTDPDDVIAKNFEFGRDASGNSVTAYISYEGDIDLIRFANPCGTGLCSIKVDVSTGSGLDLVFFGYDGEGLNFSWRARDNGFTFGDTGEECGYIEGGTLALIVREWHHSSWDYSNGLNITITGAAGCAFGCIPYPTGGCQPAG